MELDLRLTSLPILPPVWTAHGLAFAQHQLPGGVRIRFGPVPDSLESARKVGRRIEIGTKDCLLRPEPEARIRAIGGSEIVVDAPRRASDEMLAAWVCGPATVAILYQRGLTPLHASAVELDGGLVAFLAPSGTGKSSLAAAQVMGGARLVTDDILAITISEEGDAIGFPGPPWLRIPEATCDRPGTGGLRFVRQDADGKSLMEPETASVTQGPLAIRGLCLLTVGERISAERIEGTRLLANLRTLIHRPRVAEWLGTEPLIFRDLATLACRVPAWQVSRPSSGWSLPSMSKLVRELFPVDSFEQPMLRGSSAVP